MSQSMTRARKAINLAAGRFAAVRLFAQVGSMLRWQVTKTIFAQSENLAKLPYVRSSFASQLVAAASDKLPFCSGDDCAEF